MLTDSPGTKAPRRFPIGLELHRTTTSMPMQVSEFAAIHDRAGSRMNDVLTFGPFRLFVVERLLKKGNDSIPMGGRAFDLLIALVERAGEVINHKELVARVWPDVTVEGANLRVHIAALRKALGDGVDGARYVSNVPGRGYCFVASVARSAAGRSLPEVAPPGNHKLPARITRMVGREETVRNLLAKLTAWRFVSVVGPGGVGKTTVAIAVAHALIEGFRGAVFFVDLSAVADSHLVPIAVASALGFMTQSQDPLLSLLGFLGDRKVLIVLDNCEHVIDAAAELAERIMNEAPQTHILATSREALRAEGERVHMLHSLDSPPNDPRLQAAEALRYPAVQLFMERALAGGYPCELSDADAPLAANICRRLDGGGYCVASSERVASFGPFRLLPAQQVLLEGETPVRLGSRAFEILIALIERAGELVTKGELMARVWPDTVVEESNLKVHVAALRRTLGDGQPGRRYLATVTGRGYRFVAPVDHSEPQKPLAQPSAAAESAHNLPASQTRALGRGNTISALLDQLPRRRFITIVGAGGIGKTTVALAVAEALVASYEHGIRFTDLAPLSDPHFVPSALASALGLATHSDNAIPDLITYLRDKRMLLVLDSCEHVIGTAAALAEQVLAGAPGVHILATSREPLRAKGERVHRLLSLELPPNSAGLTASEAVAFASVQLFVERAAANLDGFELNDADAPVVADICRRLEGMPLAIELAATRVDAFGVRQLSVLLDDRIRLLKYGRRTVLPRHRTLTAALDWSYEFLSEDERALLRRLSVFSSVFTLDSANAVAADANSDLVEGVASLVAKSLVSADVMGAVVQYRLLDTTRAYAMQKLIESGEFEEYVRRHAEHHRGLFERAEAEWETRRTTDWLAAYARHIDDLRAALDWAFSPNGDAALGVALTVAAVPLWFQLSLINECRGRVGRALAALRPGSSGGEHRKMQLYAALGWSMFFMTAPARETGAAWKTALELAEGLGDAEYRLRALWGLWAGSINSGEFPAALALATRFRSLAATMADPADLPVGDRMVGASLHFLGDQTGARRRIELMLDRYVTRDYRSDAVRFQFDQRVTANITLARVLWLQGFADQAVRNVENNIDHALSVNHTLSLCNALAQAACPIALLAGDLPAAECFFAMLIDRAERHALDVWHVSGKCFRGQLLIKRGDIDVGLRLLGAGVDELRKAKFVQYLTAFLGALAEGLAGAGRVAQGLAAIDEALARSERNEERWCVAELLRVKGELILRAGAPQAATVAEEHFSQSLDWARRQQALSWELRAATSLAELWRGHGRTADAEQLLSSVYNSFSEGFETSDLRTARALITDLRKALADN